MSRQRCFVSLDLPGDVRKAALRVQQTLRTTHPDLRYTAPDNLHLTLKFLGEISTPQRVQVTQCLRSVSFHPFSIHLVGAGCFSPRIVWVAVRGAEALQEQVDHALKGMFAPEHRFMGHVTIARTKQMPGQLKRTLASLTVPELTAQVAQFSLQESHLSQVGPRYETLCRFGAEQPASS